MQKWLKAYLVAILIVFLVGMAHEWWEWSHQRQCAQQRLRDAAKAAEWQDAYPAEYYRMRQDAADYYLRLKAGEED